MSIKWDQFPKQALRSRAVAEVFRNSLSPEDRAAYDEATRRMTEFSQVSALDDDAIERIFSQVEAEIELELSLRRRWAQRIREEFGKYHEHTGGGDCGACGSIQAANWMDPDYVKDGPLAEPFGAWKDRQP